MPTYEFGCTNGDVFDAVYSMSEVPGDTDCIRCGAPAQRRLSAPHLSASGSAAYQLIDSTQRSAHEPEVVTSSSPGRTPHSTSSGRTQRYTHNPAHRGLPRP
ncbi:FmdB family zinc ribbon protein [Lysinibacter sp. HNR]|uniref:FmdB family zinc ribbon protein n=1 Tax=Lysinibacter sp. HNR TaxID=3031408 RepID=UPI00243522E5|nr:FmdB family zinc ribbon protein [Lysinibacter sp. HNR]WGD36561.1 zinc ribbon domain-containing protein [Lysinibacter sp. HNR]